MFRCATDAARGAGRRGRAEGPPYGPPVRRPQALLVGAYGAAARRPGPVILGPVRTGRTRTDRRKVMGSRDADDAAGVAAPRWS